MKKELLKKNMKAYRSYLRWVNKPFYIYTGMNEYGMHVLTRDRTHF